MKNFLSCDWGTSFFRLWYVEFGVKFVSVGNSEGIASTFESWKQKRKSEDERFLFFRNVIHDHIGKLEYSLGASLKDIPVVISGMASSSIGMMEIPYKESPFKADGSDLRFVKINATRDFNHDIFIISGVKTGNDVLRGEETQLAGCIKSSNSEALYILPGTHSKHIVVKKGLAVSFKTYMTGEFFELLSKKSILSSSVDSSGRFSKKENKQAFVKGVKESERSNLLHSSFLVRTNQLLKKVNAVNNYYYLSGLLIGTELAECKKMRMPIRLIASGDLRQLYVSAFKELGLKNVRSTESLGALWRGQLKIVRINPEKQNKGPRNKIQKPNKLQSRKK